MIRAGELSPARERLVELIGSSRNPKIPRSMVAQVARMARRTGDVPTSLTLLKRALSIQAKNLSELSNAEKAEYAAGLNAMGAFEQAKEILDSCDPNEYPMTLLYQSFIEFRFWRYEEAIPILKKYLSLQTDSYELLVGTVNYYAALVVAEHFKEADSVFDDVHKKIAGSDYEILKVNISEVKIQRYMLARDFSTAEKLIKSESQFNPNDTRHAFLLKKRIFFLNCKLNPDSVSNADFESFRRLAWDFGDYDSIRDADFYQADCRRDERLFAKVYYGSPFESYRRMLLRSPMASSVKDSESFIYNFPLDLNPRPYELDLFTGLVRGNTAAALEPAQLPHKLLVLLFQDFYRPAKVGQVFHVLYPDEYFDIDSGLKRVHNAIFRLREFFEKHDLGCSVVERKGGYKFNLGEKLSAQIPRGDLLVKLRDRELFLLELLKAAYQDRTFSKQDAMKCFGLSASQTWKVMKRALDEDLLKSRRQGTKVVFLF